MKEDSYIYDSIDWYYIRAIEVYKETDKKNDKNLTKNDYDEIRERASVHIAFFVTWLIKHDYLNDIFPIEDIKRLCDEKISGIDFIRKHCEEKIVRKMIRKDILSFMDDFYNEYYFSEKYVPWVINVINDLPLEFGWNWDDYYEYEKFVDGYYLLFKKRTV